MRCRVAGVTFHRYQARAVFVAVRNDKRKRPGLEIELQEVKG